VQVYYAVIVGLGLRTYNFTKFKKILIIRKNIRVPDLISFEINKTRYNN